LRQFGGLVITGSWLFVAAAKYCPLKLHLWVWLGHRDKTRVQMPAKMFPHLKLLCSLFMGPTLGFDTKQINSLLIKYGFFTIKARF
jgi:hypothetical protein